VLAVGDGLHHEGAGRLIAADEFDDHIDLRVGEHLLGIVDQLARRGGHAAIGGDVAVGNAHQLQTRAEAPFHQGAVALKDLDHTGTDGAEPEQTDVDLFHCHSLF